MHTGARHTCRNSKDIWNMPGHPSRFTGPLQQRTISPHWALGMDISCLLSGHTDTTLVTVCTMGAVAGCTDGQSFSETFDISLPLGIWGSRQIECGGLGGLESLLQPPPRLPLEPTPPPPLCHIPSGCYFFAGPWTVTRSSIRVLRPVAAFCRPLWRVLLLVSFPRLRSPIVGVPGLCWLRRVPFVR